MSLFYANAPPPARSPHYQPQSVGAVQYPRPAPHTFSTPHDHSCLWPALCSFAADLSPAPDFYEMIKKGYADRDSRLLDAISRWFPNLESRQQCLDFVKHLRIHRNLFMYTYVHLVFCCQSRHLHRLVDNANLWKKWDSVQQLARHSLIRDKLLSFWADRRCRHHEFLLAQHFVINDDESDLLCHLLYCGSKPELYELPNKPAIQECDYYLKESEQVVELLWQFLMKPQQSGVVRRLRAHIYRMARKSAYLPHALQIGHPSISNRRSLGAGASAIVTKATMNGLHVVVKEILCRDSATQRKCLEMFASEAILWKTLQHKNIVPFLGVVANPGTPNIGLVSPFFKNGNIRNHMKKYDPRDWRTLARRWGRDLAEALEYIHCHEPPIVHGDLKGDNVLVHDDGHALLGDFGQSYASDSGKYLDSTRVGLAASNPVHWMAPELMVGGDRVKASDKSDIYSFGCVLYEMVSGRIPFEGLSSGRVVDCVSSGVHPNSPESISSNDPLWEIAKSCWRNPPEDRPSAARLVSRLRSYSFR